MNTAAEYLHRKRLRGYQPLVSMYIERNLRLNFYATFQYFIIINFILGGGGGGRQTFLIFLFSDLSFFSIY
jgi:hypothetical protein